MIRKNQSKQPLCDTMYRVSKPMVYTDKSQFNTNIPSCIDQNRLGIRRNTLHSSPQASSFTSSNLRKIGQSSPRRPIQAPHRRTFTKAPPKSSSSIYGFVNADAVQHSNQLPNENGASSHINAKETTPLRHNILVLTNFLPDSKGTAAGVRTYGILRILAQLGFQPIIGTIAKIHTGQGDIINRLSDIGVLVTRVAENDPTDDLERFLRFLDATEPDNLAESHSVLADDTDTSHTGRLSGVIYDRFMVEELFGHRVRAVVPNALNIIDTQDLHFLRYARMDTVGEIERLQQELERLQSPADTVCPANTSQSDQIDTLQSQVLHLRQKLDQLSQSDNPHMILNHLDSRSSDATREIASILRSDLNLVVSNVEEDLLHAIGIPTKKVVHIPITYPPSITHGGVALSRPFSKRESSMFIGTMRHPPNVDCCHYLRDTFSPILELTSRDVMEEAMAMSSTTPQSTDHPQRTNQHKPNKAAMIHVYGSHMTDVHKQLSTQPTQLHDSTGMNSNGDDSTPKHGHFTMKGFALDAISTLSKYKVLLTPLRYGAGVKGKVLDAFFAGTPVVATPITAEGMEIDYKQPDQIPLNPLTCTKNKSKQYTNICDILHHRVDNALKTHNGVDQTSNNNNPLHTAFPGVIHHDPAVLTASTLLLNHCECEWSRQHNKITSVLSNFSDSHGMNLLSAKLHDLAFDRIPIPVPMNNDGASNHVLIPNPTKLQDLRKSDFIGQSIQYSTSQALIHRSKAIIYKKRLVQHNIPTRVEFDQEQIDAAET